MFGSLPMEFPGTVEEKRANEATHIFISDGDECPRCGGCDCRMGGTSSGWPCGAEVPRIDPATREEASV